MAMATAIPHPRVITIQPEFSALEFLSRTPATTPSPRMMRSIVPTNSPRYACIRPSLLERPSCRHVARRFQVVLHLVVELEQRYGEARHLKRGHVVSDVGHPPDLYALALQDVMEVGVGDVELHQGRAAHTVDDHGDLRVREVHGITQDLAKELLDYPVRRLYLLALDAGLAVDADPDLHLVRTDVEDGLAALGRSAAGQRHPHRAHVAVYSFGELLDAREILAIICRGAADLVHEDGARYPAPPARVGRVLNRHVVVGDDVVGLDVFGLGEFSRHLEVEDVAGVVLYDVENPRAAVDGLGRLEHLLGGRAREDRARASGVEHPLSDVAAVGRLVPRAAAGDEGDLAFNGSVGADDDVVLGDDPDEPRVGEPHSAQHLLDDPLGGVDELLHVFLSVSGFATPAVTRRPPGPTPWPARGPPSSARRAARAPPRPS